MHLNKCCCVNRICRESQFVRRNGASYALGYLSCCSPPLTQGTPALLHEEQDGTCPSHCMEVSRLAQSAKLVLSPLMRVWLGGADVKLTFIFRRWHLTHAVRIRGALREDVRIEWSTSDVPRASCGLWWESGVKSMSCSRWWGNLGLKLCSECFLVAGFGGRTGPIAHPQCISGHYMISCLWKMESQSIDGAVKKEEEVRRKIRLDDGRDPTDPF